MNELITLILLVAAGVSFLAAVVVALCVFAIVGHTEKMQKTLAAMESLMRHGK